MDKNRNWTILLRLALWGLILTSLVYRCWRLDSAPGLNGDEAWYGLQAQAVVIEGELPRFRTPTGNLLNPFFYLPAVAVHSFLSASGATMRSISVLSGVLALCLNYWLCCRLFDRRLAVVSTIVLAILPINIIYSRFAWDASQSLLFTLIVLYLALGACRGAASWTAVALAQAAACLVHPTNIFIAPIWIAALIEATFGEMEDRELSPQRLAFWRRAYVGLALSASMILSIAAARPAGAAQYALHVGRLLTGVTGYRYVTGATAPDTPILSVWQSPMLENFTLAIMLGLLVASAVFAVMSRQRQWRALGIGWVVSLMGFLVVAGVARIVPHQERYAMWMVAPSGLLLSQFVSQIGARFRGVDWTALLVGAACLVGFYFNYFEYMRRTGGESHRAFRTAEIEPRRQTAAVLRDLAGSADFWVIAGNWPDYNDQWWIEKPLRYLLGRHDNIHVIDRADLAVDFDSRFRSGRVAMVGFYGTPVTALAKAEARRIGVPVVERVVTDAAGRPLIWILAADSLRGKGR